MEKEFTDREQREDPVEKMTKDETGLRGKLGGFWEGILLLFPVFGIPKALGFSALLLLAFLAGFLLFSAFTVSCFVAGTSGIAGLLAGVSVWNTEKAVGMFYLGAGLCILGLAVLLLLAAGNSWKVIFKVIGAIMESMLNGRRKRERGKPKRWVVFTLALSVFVFVCGGILAGAGALKGGMKSLCWDMEKRSLVVMDKERADDMEEGNYLYFHFW